MRGAANQFWPLQNARGGDRLNSLAPALGSSVVVVENPAPSPGRISGTGGSESRWQAMPLVAVAALWYLAKAKVLAFGLSNVYFKSLGLPTLFSADDRRPCGSSSIGADRAMSRASWQPGRHPHPGSGITPVSPCRSPAVSAIGLPVGNSRKAISCWPNPPVPTPAGSTAPAP